MVKKAKGKHRLDKFYRLAKEQGYRSRAAFKLLQLNRQFKFLERTRTCLDLCAAPGGWMQVAVSQMPLNSLVIGIDLDPIKPVRGAKSIVGDITTAKARAAIKKEAGGSMMEVVLHDGAPNVGGVWASEAYSQSTLVLDALKLATEFLVPNGTFVTKIFRSQDYTALLYAFKLLFNKVEATKPAASRDTSAEIFVVCLGYKAPSKIDPRLLDARHLFKEVTEEPKSMGPDALLKQKIKQKRFREGYEEGLSSMHKEIPAAAFITTDSPVEMLGQYTKFSLTSQPAFMEEEDAEQKIANAAILKHPATNAEVKALVNDLQVLGRSEFKALLRWRLKLRRELGLGTAKSKSKAEEESEAVEEEKDPEEKLLEEMQEVKDNMNRREKREKKKKLEAKKKFRLRAAQLDKSEGIADATGPDTLFSLATIKGHAQAGLDEDMEAPDEDAAADSEPDLGQGSSSEEEDLDSDEERRRYEDDQEEAIEEAYQDYLFRQGQRAKIAELKNTKEAKPGDLLGKASAEDNKEDESLEPPKKRVKALAGIPESGDLSSDEEDLLLPVEAQEDAEEEDEDAEVMVPKGSKHSSKVPPISKTSPAAIQDDSAYQEVPLSEPESDSAGSSDTDLEEPDEHTAAEIRAYAKAMLHGRTRSDVLEAGYHRYAFHDENVPSWLADDEKRHMKPPPVVTKGDVEAEKQRVRALDSQPIKKIAEAKARKKKRLQVRLEQAKSKANSILEQGDLSERAKAKEVAALYAKAKASGKAPKKKPSRSDKFKKKGPPLDRRMYSDKRPVNNKSKKKAAKSRKKGQGKKGKGKAR